MTAHFSRGRAIFSQVWRRSLEDRVATAASSVAFYVLLGSMPALAVVILLYGSFADSADVAQRSLILTGLVPADIAQILDRQVLRLVGQESDKGRSLLASAAWIAFLVWSANRGMRGIVDALNTIYDRAEGRSFFRSLAVTMLMTTGLIVVVALSLFGVIILPAILEWLPFSAGIARWVGLLRWPALLFLEIAATALLLRFGPSRKGAYWTSVLIGSAVSALLWLTLSILFSWYAQHFANFSILYGAMGSVIVFMIWLWLSALSVLVGAELDAAITRSRQGGSG